LVEPACKFCLLNHALLFRTHVSPAFKMVGHHACVEGALHYPYFNCFRGFLILLHIQRSQLLTLLDLLLYIWFDLTGDWKWRDPWCNNRDHSMASENSTAFSGTFILSLFGRTPPLFLIFFSLSFPFFHLFVCFLEMDNCISRTQT